MSYGFYLIFFVGTLLPSIFYEIYSANILYGSISSSGGYSYAENLFLTCMLNPALYLAEFFMQLMTGESLVNSMGDSIAGTAKIGGPIRLVTVGHRWLIVSTILFLTVSFLFLWLAVRRIDPVRRRGRKRNG